ncbi:MAG: nitroreductase family protein [Methanosarcinales archaeon]|nr:nitroreductase family protein [Methanosarcinales archaeon]
MTECMDTIYKRRSVRKFTSDPVERQIVEKLIQDAQMAPSAGNLQARDFIVVTNMAVRKKLKEAALDQKFIVQAPVVIVFCANTPRSSRIYSGRGELYSIQDASISVMVMMLAAHDMGLATCWVGAFNETDVAEILMIPHNIRPICMLALGYSADTPKASNRIDSSKLTHWESW